MDDLINIDDLNQALSELKDVSYVAPELEAEMEASRKRYEEYIKKHAKNND
ncbi:MAG: hypothetical protein GX225_04730 [Clostridiales bacterium]|nr:hypothetical protein [Clostridiales bacterium]